jgi:hypothetical protein
MNGREVFAVKEIISISNGDVQNGRNVICVQRHGEIIKRAGPFFFVVHSAFPFFVDGRRS